MSSLYLPAGLDVVGNLAYDLRVELAQILGADESTVKRIRDMTKGDCVAESLTVVLQSIDILLLNMKEVLDAERLSSSTSP